MVLTEASTLTTRRDIQNKSRLIFERCPAWTTSSMASENLDESWNRRKGSMMVDCQERGARLETCVQPFYDECVEAVFRVGRHGPKN